VEHHTARKSLDEFLFLSHTAETEHAGYTDQNKAFHYSLKSKVHLSGQK
jgi:hypothetical protein